ncbi:MAG: TIGR03751 family conjugal transfer lipoprotein [Gammaproteobacteria bacterium]|nr:TIGR03751 family conjugal transfer lipoprotein [Gammaproteobacteria bacterium]
MLKTWTLTAAPALISALLLAACTTTKDDVLPQDGPPMKQLYEDHFQRIGEQRLHEIRERLQRGSSTSEAGLHGYVRDAHNEIRALFPRVPTPTLVMFVFPHLAGSEEVPVPGYATSFPMYNHTQYALPGEN